MSPDNRIDRRFAELRGRGRKALVPFITCGDPSLEATVPVMHALVRAGADVIELGIPFSDPQADGPVIQRASERALERKVGLRAVLACCEAFRREDADTPIVLMGYLNPVEIFGEARFAAAARAAGVDGVLLVDCPPEEAAGLRGILATEGLDLVMLASPTSDDARLRLIAGQAAGYLYYVSFAGVTGAGGLDVDAVAARMATVRAISSIPVAVGFGVRDAASAKRVAACADGVVIGSALVETLARCASPDEAAAAAEAFLAPVRAALDAG